MRPRGRWTRTRRALHTSFPRALPVVAPASRRSGGCLPGGAWYAMALWRARRSKSTCDRCGVGSRRCWSKALPCPRQDDRHGQTVELCRRELERLVWGAGCGQDQHKVPPPAACAVIRHGGGSADRGPAAHATGAFRAVASRGLAAAARGRPGWTRERRAERSRSRAPSGRPRTSHRGTSLVFAHRAPMLLLRLVGVLLLR